MIQWRKSSYSQDDGHGNCVEISTNTSALLVRDSKDPAGPSLAFSRREMVRLADQIKAGRLA
jgi:hypothetical protein